MKKKISFGKYAIYGNRKINEIEVEIELREDNNKPVFSVCGTVWNAKKTDSIMGGQCLDKINKYVDTPLFKDIYRLWKEYHLNDMQAGSAEQMEALKGLNLDYTKACEYLKELNLYEVEYNGEPYKYGHSWLYKEIPTKDLELIKSIVG